MFNTISFIQDTIEKGSFKNEALTITKSESKGYDLDFRLTIDADEGYLLGAIDLLYNIGRTLPLLRVNVGIDKKAIT